MRVFKAQNLEDSDNKINHAFFGRNGGVSDGIYASLNCGLGSNDAPDKVMQNRLIVADYFGQDLKNLSGVNQIHSPDCLILKDCMLEGEERPKADAIVTDTPGLILGVLTADCGPVLFYGRTRTGVPVIGAAHAGWRGAIGGVLEGTLRRMVECGAELSGIQAAIGPCIGPKSYEVNEEFIEPFMAQDDANEHFFKDAQKDGHLMFDLPGYIASRLAIAGVKDITITGHDTFADEDNFFSYRRKTHRNEPDYGRQISAIMIRE